MGNKEDILHQIGTGAAAGLVGTAAMEAIRTANRRLSPDTAPIHGTRDDVVDRVREALPQSIQRTFGGGLKSAASLLLSFGYGSAGAAVYSALRNEPKVLVDGAALGVTLWAVSHMGWLPMLHSARPLRKPTPKQMAMSVGQHVLYGVATVAAYRKLKSSVRA